MSEEKKPKKKTGRPLKVIEPVDPEQYAYDMGSLGTPQDEVAARLDLDKETFRRRLLSYYNMGLRELTTKLRTVQIRVATGEADPEGKPHSGMLVWLGKQLLKQRDKQDVEHSSNEEKPMYFFPITRDYPPPTYEERKKDKNSRGSDEEEEASSGS